MSTAVNQMFNSIAHRYDLANDVLSLGLHRRWRKLAISFAKIRPGARVLDLCTGTGDFAFDLADVVGSSGSVLGVDFAERMLEGAREKQERNSRYAHISFRSGDALQIPAEDNTFDAVTISFGIRNVDDLSACLKEMLRVLKPNGVATVLEFGQPTLPLFSSFYHWYSASIMPRIGGAITGNRPAYEYLPQTSKVFPAGANFVSHMLNVKFANVRMKPLCFGVAYIYCGYKPPILGA